jgi:hypothetical protein
MTHRNDDDTTTASRMNRHPLKKKRPRGAGKWKWLVIASMMMVVVFLWSLTVTFRQHETLLQIMMMMEQEEVEQQQQEAVLVGQQEAVGMNAKKEEGSELTSASTPPPPPDSIGSCHNLTWRVSSSASSSSSSKPVWVASFPGSGAELFRQLTSHVTGGLPAWSIYIKDNNYNNNNNKTNTQNIPQTCLTAPHAVTCKTHWPVLDFQPIDFDSVSDSTNKTTSSSSSTTTNKNNNNYHSQAIVLLRNPISAFPSRFNHQWELRNNVGYHVKQAPEHAWNNWIRRTFDDQQSKFEEFVLAWSSLGGGGGSSSNDSRVALYVPYEGLIDPTQGPMWTRKIIQVLQEAGAARTIQENDDQNQNQQQQQIACLWNDAVRARPTRKRAPHTYRPGYTVEQHAKLQRLLDNVIAKVVAVNSNNNNNNNNATRRSHSPELLAILQTYRKDIQTTNESSIRIL